MIKTKIVSSLCRVFHDTDIDSLTRLERISALKGERLSFQLITRYVREDGDDLYAQKKNVKPVISGELAKYARLRRVSNVVAEHTYYPAKCDEYYERTEPGLYPDLLSPLTYGGMIITKANMPSSTWIDLKLPEGMTEVGDSAFTVELFDDSGSKLAEETLVINVIDEILPEQTLICTDWFHCDSLANYYDVEVWSEKHWKIIENFARVAYDNGVNMLLTPVLTPPLDTAVGGERLTTQLVGITLEKGVYSFDFSLLDRWVDMCDRIGFKYFEISHLFTQWGAKHAPKVMATVDGEYKKIFGWKTDAVSEEYTSFLRQFLTELIEHMKKSGNDKRCMFHISDEPEEAHFENYKAAKTSIADVLEGYQIMDALSGFEFYQKGIVEMPIPCNDHIQPFIDANVPNLWTYYCCGQCVGVSNRLVSMPAARNRSIGMQMYKYDIVGFLHWGFNFYNNQFSVDPLQPYTDLSGEHWVPAGDTFSVYPGHKGVALESPRLVVFHEGLQDMRAMKLCEKYFSKEEIVSKIEEILGAPLTFSVCAYDEATMLKIRGAVNKMILEGIGRK